MTVEVFVVDAVRTPVGKLGGALAGMRPDDLAAHALQGLLTRNPALDPERIDEVFLGDANGAGEDNRNVARMASLLAGLPVQVPASTVNRLCGSGMEATIQGSRSIALGDASICVVGGVESMSRAPWVMLKPERPFPHDHATMYSSTLGWRMVNPRIPEQWTVSLGEGAEILAERYHITREEQDAFALRSHQRAHAAWEDGRFNQETICVPDTALERDEGIRPDTSLEKLAKLRPAFRPDGTVTAGNASGLNDGAATLLLADEKGMRDMGGQPLGRIISRAVSGVEPHLYGIGPVEAAQKALDRAGIRWNDLVAVELNEAFAAQALACAKSWPELDLEILNPNGGAIAIGHPLGCSGGRILTTLLWELRCRGGGWGLATMCIGVGQGIAVVVEGFAEDRKDRT